jgi:lysozyme family protein
VAKFELFLPILLKHEGGYVNHPDDPGGETNMGITMATFKQASKKLLGLEPTSENLKALDAQQAGVIYRRLYWDRIKGDELTLQELANLLCDFYVNAGSHAIKTLQYVLRSMGSGIAADGHMGTETMRALQSYDPVTVYRALKARRIQYYKDKGVAKPMFLAGWLNRVNSFPDIEEV